MYTVKTSLKSLVLFTTLFTLNISMSLSSGELINEAGVASHNIVEPMATNAENNLYLLHYYLTNDQIAIRQHLLNAIEIGEETTITHMFNSGVLKSLIGTINPTEINKNLVYIIIDKFGREAFYDVGGLDFVIKYDDIDLFKYAFSDSLLNKIGIGGLTLLDKVSKIKSDKILDYMLKNYAEIIDFSATAQFRNKKLLLLVYHRFGIGEQFELLRASNAFAASGDQLCSLTYKHLSKAMKSKSSREWARELEALLAENNIIDANCTINNKGITYLEKLIQENDINRVPPMFAKLDLNSYDPNESHFIYSSDIKSCAAPYGQYEEKMRRIDTFNTGGNYNVHHIAFDPLVTVQNGCSALVTLIDGSVWEIENADASELRRIFLREFYGVEIEEPFAAIDIYLSPGHGFMSVDCEGCGADGKNLNFAFGLYPRMDPLNPEYAIRYENTISDAWNQLLSKASIHYQPGYIQDEQHRTFKVRTADEMNHVKIRFYVSIEDANKLISLINEMKNNCEKGENKCYYHIVTRNCVEFVQEVLASIGIQTDYRLFVRDEQLGHGYFEQVLQGGQLLDAYKASSYSFLKTRTLSKSMYNLIYAMLPHSKFSSGPSAGTETR